MKVYTLFESDKPEKKFLVISPEGKKVYFGASGYSDYTKHKDPKRKDNYIKRHKKRENWSKSGLNTAGFWSRWLLWNKPTIEESLAFIADRFNVIIDY